MSVKDTATEEVDTSTNEETLDAEKDLEESNASFDDAEDTSEKDADESEESDGFDDDDDSADESDEETEEETQEDVKDKDAEDQDTDSEADRKRHNDEMAKKRIAEKEEREKSKVDAQRKYLDASEEAYDAAIKRGLSPEDAETEKSRDLALRQLQVDAYNNKVQRNTDTLENGLEKAVARIDLLSKGTPEEKEAMAEALDDFERMYVVRDRNGDPVDVKGDVFDYLQRKADSIRKLTGVGARTAKTAKGNMTARTVTVPGRKPKEGKKDELLEGFDEEADRW